MITISRSIVKNHRNFFRYPIFKIKYATRNTLIFPNIWQWSLTLWYFFIFNIFVFKIFLTNKFLHFAVHLLMTPFFFFLKLIMFIVFTLRDLQYFFIQSLPLYISCLFSMRLNDNIVYIPKSDEICSTTFTMN